MISTHEGEDAKAMSYIGKEKKTNPHQRISTAGKQVID